MKIEIADHILERAGITPEEILLELAIVLFKEERITLGQGSKIAGMHQIQFQRELAKRKIPVHYDIKDFERDMETIKQF